MPCQRIQRYTARMNRLAADLLDVVSIEAGRLAMVPQQQNAAELAPDTLEAFSALSAANGISIRTEVRAGSLLAQRDFATCIANSHFAWPRFSACLAESMTAPAAARALRPSGLGRKVTSSRTTRTCCMKARQHRGALPRSDSCRVGTVSFSCRARIL
jgi:hypothetical protein